MSEELEAIPELDPGVLDLLDHYKAHTARDAAQADAALGQVSAKLAAGASTATGTGLSVGAKVLLASAVLGTVAWVATRPAPVVTPTAPIPAVAAAPLHAPQPSPDEPVPDEPAPPAPAPPSRPPTLQAEVPRSAPPPAPPTQTTTPRPRSRVDSKTDDSKTVDSKPVDSKPVASLAEELRLLREARTNLRAGRAAAALTQVSTHRKDYPSSALAEERDATEVMALCALGRTDAATRKATAYAQRFPDSKRSLLTACDTATGGTQ